MKLPWQRDSETRAQGGEAPIELPEPSQEVSVAMPDGERLPARVAKREGDELLILMMVPAKETMSDAELREIVLELTSAKGLVRLAGDAVLEDRDLLRFRDLHSVDILQRREYVRVQTSRPVLVSIGGRGQIESSSVDLSGGGMLLGGLEHLPVGSQLEFRLTTDGDSPPITGTGRVVRSDHNGRCAIAFRSISEGNRRRLIRFLFDCQREERRKGLRLGDESGD